MNLSNLIIVIFWLVVAITHLVLMMKHFMWSRQQYSPLPKRGEVGKIIGLPLGVKESTEDINVFISRLNKDYHQSNIAQFWGYMAGFIASLIGFILSLNLLYH